MIINLTRSFPTKQNNKHKRRTELLIYPLFGNDLIMNLTLTIDFGSTYTKIAAFDLAKEELVCSVQAKTTVDSDITIGLKKATAQLENMLGTKKFAVERMLSCSSAAGGLRMIAIGLTKPLTTKAAKEAVLGAGAKLTNTYHNLLASKDLRAIELTPPDLILLAGGTDGGNKEVIIENAKFLAKAQINVPIIIAGNKNAAGEIQKIFREAGKYAIVTENILPELDKLNIDPAKNAIREVFMKRITHAKGLDKVEKLVGNICMPTPMAVLKGAALLSEGIKGENGLGDLVVLDIGGATTDIHSLAYGYPTHVDRIFKGLPEPYAKRTVEGDLGIRYNAHSILEMVGEEKIIEDILSLRKEHLVQDIDVNSYIKYLSEHVDHVPKNENEVLFDISLAGAAIKIAMQRHAGKVEEVYFPTGKARIQYGKDLTGIKNVIGTGGIFVHSKNPHWILKSACFDSTTPESLSPIDPTFLIDKHYLLYAIGLLSEISPIKALRILKKYLSTLKSSSLRCI
jgi:uncharacterized protein (TIGR01319 family)